MPFVRPPLGRVRRWLTVVTGVAAILLCLRGTPTAGQGAAESDEYTVKAAFLFNFTKFIDWPAEAFVSPGAPIVIAVIGSDPFGPVLDRTVQGEVVNGRPIVVQRLKWEDSLAEAHVLYVSPSEWRRLPRILDRLGGLKVLTVGDHEDFVRAGGVIQFQRQNYRIRFAINTAAAERAGLRISSKLLSVATLVGRDGDHR